MASDEGSWHGNGQRYRRRGAIAWRIEGQGWMAMLTASPAKVYGPYSNAIVAMERADALLQQANKEKVNAV